MKDQSANQSVIVLPSTVIYTELFKSVVRSFISNTRWWSERIFTGWHVIAWCLAWIMITLQKLISIYPRTDWFEKQADLSGDALHYHPGYRSDCSPFRVIEWTLWMIQAGQGTDLLLGHSGLVWRLKGKRWGIKKKHKAIDLWDFKNNTHPGFVWQIHLCKHNKRKVSQSYTKDESKRLKAECAV